MKVRDWLMSHYAAETVSVPLRGSGMKAGVLIPVDALHIGIVSVPLRGSGMKERTIWLGRKGAVDGFRPLAGKWDERARLALIFG